MLTRQVLFHTTRILNSVPLVLEFGGAPGYTDEYTAFRELEQNSPMQFRGNFGSLVTYYENDSRHKSCSIDKMLC